jgi:hypothetical protein
MEFLRGERASERNQISAARPVGLDHEVIVGGDSMMHLDTIKAVVPVLSIQKHG